MTPSPHLGAVDWHVPLVHSRPVAHLPVPVHRSPCVHCLSTQVPSHMFAVHMYWQLEPLQETEWFARDAHGVHAVVPQ